MIDQINSGFVMFAVGLAMLDILEIRRTRRLEGLTVLTAILFTVWPLWDMYYYAHLEQFTSLLVCSVLAILRVVWFGHVLATLRPKR